MSKNQINTIFKRSQYQINMESNEKIIDFHSQVLSVTTSPNSNKLLVCIYYDNPQIWDINTEKLLSTINEKNITSVSWSPDGNKIVTGNNTNNIAKIWDVTTQTPVSIANIEVKNNINALSWSPDGNQIAIGTVVKNGTGSISI